MLYLYDSTFDGLMTAIFDIYRVKDAEASILAEGHLDNETLFDVCPVQTDENKSARVQKGLYKLGSDVPYRMYQAWLSGEVGVADLILSVCRLGFESKRNPFAQRQHDAVFRLSSLAQKVGRESHRMLQFVRFIRLSEDLYAADIEPQYDVLVLIGDHFHDRFPQHRFIIRNLAHRTAIVSSPAGWHLTSLPENNPPLPKSGTYEALWKTYFQAIANVHRINPKLQQSHVPLKYRKNLTEFENTEDIP